MQLFERLIRSRSASSAVALWLLVGAACIEGEPTIEERACEAAPDCYQGNPCLIDRCVEGRCVEDPIDESLPGGADFDDDGLCDAADADDDDDGRNDDVDRCPLSPTDAIVDYDGDGCFDGEDDDDDDDGLPDEIDACPNSVRLQERFVSNPINDIDGDGCHDGVDNQDADGDGVLDGMDLCRFDGEMWLSTPETDHDRDGCQDATIDPDDDNDGLPDGLDDCPRGDRGWFSNPDSDHDRDGCRDAGDEDDDDDGDGVPDEIDACDETPPSRDRIPVDRDRDGCDDDLEDADDDGDGVPDVADACPHDIELGVGSDLDGDGCVANDPDNDNDGVPDVRDDCVSAAVTNWASFPGTDADGDGCRDLDEDDDDDGDGVLDRDDACPLDEAVDDIDGDGCDEAVDEDDDGDGVPDVVDLCPAIVGDADAEDYDGDGCFDGDDDDDDDDGIPDELDDCLGQPGRRATPALDRDRDGCIDGREDDDDDNDGRPDALDRCPVGQIGWSSDNPEEDHDGDGCRDIDEDDDDDDDGVPDAADCDRLDATRAPGLAEVCDSADNDCDGGIDEGTRQVFFRDADGDGFGDPDNRSRRCPGSAGWVQDGTDCDDAVPEANPRDGCPAPVGSRDGQWRGGVSIEIFGRAGERFDICRGTIDVIVDVEAEAQVRGDYTCTFEGPLADRDVQLGSLSAGRLSADELGAEGLLAGLISGGFVIIFDGPDHGLGYLGGALPGAFGEVDFEAFFEIGRGALP